MYNGSIAGVQLVYDLLAKDARKMMGMEELNEHKKLKKILKLEKRN